MTGVRCITPIITLRSPCPVCESSSASAPAARQLLCRRLLFTETTQLPTHPSASVNRRPYRSKGTRVRYQPGIKGREPKPPPLSSERAAFEVAPAQNRFKSAGETLRTGADRKTGQPRNSRRAPDACNAIRSPRLERLNNRHGRFTRQTGLDGRQEGACP